MMMEGDIMLVARGQTDDGVLLIDTVPESDCECVVLEEEPGGLSQDGNVFTDGSTPIDFVLVWEESLKDNDDEGSSHRELRRQFLSRLRAGGLMMEQREVSQSEKRIYFVLLSAPWSVMCYYAEEINLRVPLQVVHSPFKIWSEQVLLKLSIPNFLSQDVPNSPTQYYTCHFRSNKQHRFLGGEDKKTLFKPTQRHQVVYEILARTLYGSAKKGEVGMDRLISEGVFAAAYPLHEGDVEASVESEVHSGSLRQTLYSYWSQWSCWRRYQPMDHIREYFGEKIALYFAWLGFYTSWLLLASVVGTTIFLIGFILMATDVPANEVCSPVKTFIMCPVCEICPYWNYSSICFNFRAGILFDNGGTVFYSVFIALWAVTLLEFWKRTSATLSHRWGCSDFEETEQRPRPEFTAMAPMTMRNPVTGAEEPYFPRNQQLHRMLTGCGVIIIMVVVVLIFVFSIILYRTITSFIIYKSSAISSRSLASRLASITASFLNLVVILLLSKLYVLLAKVLTRWEMHRTQTRYEDMFILKVFVFQFVNFYSSPIYIAFFKGRFVGYPGKYQTLFGVHNEDCGAGGCLIDLAQELLIIMVGKQMVSNIQEFLVVKLKAWWQRRKTLNLKELNKEGVEICQWEKDYQLQVCEGLFDEYLELVIQYGFITIFVAACPLAPLFALFNNWIEIRLDANKFIKEYRRPVAERVQDIGIWFPILEFVTHAAVLSNAFIIAFTSSFVPRLYYRYTRDASMSGYINFTLATSPLKFTHEQHGPPCRYHSFRDEEGKHKPEYFHLIAIRLGFIIIFEHLVFLVGHAINLGIPDVPQEVKTMIKREHYMAKEVLAENQALLLINEHELPMDAELLVEAELPVEAVLLVEAELPVEEELLVEAAVPVEEELLVEAALPVEAELPVEEELLVEAELPVEAETPAALQPLSDSPSPE